MGALIMFELTRYLEATRGVVPVHLFASASPPPDDYIVPSFDPATHRYVRQRGSLRRHLVPIFALPDAEFLEVLRFLNFGPTRVLLDEPELLAQALPLLRADFEVCSTYRFARDSTFDVPLTAFTGDEDPFAGVAEGRSWQRRTQASFELSVHQGDHYFLFPRMSEVVSRIAHTIERSTVFHSPGKFRSGVPPADLPARPSREIARPPKKGVIS
jgi:surfactin synthase thioesterase subunit